MTEAATARPIYAVERLVVDLYTATQSVRAVDGVSFAIRPGETVAVVGESGSGKTVSMLGPLGLLPEGVTVAMGGTATVAGTDILTDERRRRGARGRVFGVIFQDPMSALNPMRRVGPQIARQVRRFSGASAVAARAEAVSLLRRTRIADPEDRYRRYPHEMSGGMLQRAMIALALASRPRVLLADEPTTALDATVQAQILDLLRAIQKEDGLAIVLITHDIGAVSATADRVLVMYAGRVVEEGTAAEVLLRPVHPYTRGLLASVPDLWRPGGVDALREIPGAPPDLSWLAPGCRFADRCPIVQPPCRRHRPELLPVAGGSGHRAACPVALGSPGRG